jgi:hypothetical protein
MRRKTAQTARSISMMNRSRMVAALKDRGEDPSTGLGGTITKEREAEILGKIHAKYGESMSPYYAAAGPGPDPGWMDAIIDPLETRIPTRRRDRSWISKGIEAASESPATREFNMGGLQP